MARVLFLTSSVPSESGNGVEKRAWAHLAALARIGPVAMAVADWGQRLSIDRLPLAEALCERSIVLSCSDRAPGKSAPVAGASLLRALAAGNRDEYPLTDESAQAFRRLVSDFAPEIVFCFRCPSGHLWNRHGTGLLPHEPGLIVDFDDIESVAMQRQFAIRRRSLGFESGLLVRLAIARQKAAERRFLRQAAGIVVCSGDDETLLRARVPAANVCVVPNSVSLPPLPPPRPGGGPARLLFVGTMNYPPNQDAAIHFCREILPLIRAESDDRVAVSLVGFRPPAAVEALGEIPDVRVTGGVESVVPYYEEADIVLCPIRFGGGTRIKILEAMSFARPVVSTTIGAEGLDVTAGSDILIGDSPRAFADACLDLIRSPSLRASVGAAGRALIEGKYAADSVRDTTAAAIARLTHRQAAPLADG